MLDACWSLCCLFSYLVDCLFVILGFGLILVGIVWVVWVFDCLRCICFRLVFMCVFEIVLFCYVVGLLCYLHCYLLLLVVFDWFGLLGYWLFVSLVIFGKALCL